MSASSIDGAIADADKIGSIAEFKDWTRRLRLVFPHEMLLSGWGRVYVAGLTTDTLVAVDFPWSYLEGTRNPAGAQDTPILRALIATREPQLFEIERPWPGVPLDWLENFRKHDMRNCAQHGLIDEANFVASFHTFYRIPGALGPAHVEALKRLIPAMHNALCRVVERMNQEGGLAANLATLSPREKEMVEWVCQGKTNSEIAALSGLSENTVKHHLTNVFGKLGAKTRAQLMHRLAAQGMSRGLPIRLL